MPKIHIHFDDPDSQHKALGLLIPRCSGKSWATGDTIVPSEALAFLALKNISFKVVGRATYKQLTPQRDFSAAKSNKEKLRRILQK